MSKSYWQTMMTEGENSQRAIKSWFSPLIDEDMTVSRAEVLCDKATDREKKARVFATDKDGKRFKFERTLGVNFSISRTEV